MDTDKERADYERKYDVARTTPAFMRSNEFIHAKLFRPDLYSLLLEMGPNCNLSCFHCGSNNSPNRIGLPNLEVITNALNGAIRTGITRTALTFGEPLRNENKEILKPIGQSSAIIPTHIVTNGTFSKTKDSAGTWFEYLKEAGFDFSKQSYIDVSFGKMYPTSSDNWHNILLAAKKVFPKTNPGNFLTFSQIGVYEDKDMERINELLEVIDNVFGKRRKEQISIEEDTKNIKIRAYPKEGTPIRIYWHRCNPFGRACDLDLFDKSYPIQKLMPQNLVIDSDNARTLAVFNTGDVCFSDCTGDFERNYPYGNVKKEQLGTIIDRIRHDVFFQGYKLGGVALLYYAAQKVKPDFIITGRSRWNVLNEIFHDKKLIDRIRNYFTKEGVVDSYKEYISKVDMRVRRAV